MKRFILVTLLALVASQSPVLQAGQAQKPAPQQPAPKSTLSPEALDKLLAPIALYPDQLLAQMLLCAGNPGKVATLAEWVASNDSLKGSDLQAAAAKAGFDQSFATLVLFPDVLNAMAANIEATAQIGQAFTADRSAVFGSIQRLRAKAKAAGTLKSSPQQNVETKTTSSGQEAIIIEPANPQVVYVPQYNPQVVYTQPSTTVVVQESSNDDAVAAGLIGFTAGIALGAAIDNDYYYGPYGWHGGAYMYNDAWDDWYDEREDAREDWADHREDLAEERGDRAQNAQEQRTERTQSRQENRPESQAQRDQRRADAQAKAQERTGGTSAQATAQERSTARTGSQESRGYSGEKTRPTTERSGTKSDAFSGYSSGRSASASSQRGQRSRSSSRGGGGGGRRR
jgi:hypothetical protein